MAKISTLSSKSNNESKTTKSEANRPSESVIRNIMAYSKALQVKPSVYLGKVSNVNN